MENVLSSLAVYVVLDLISLAILVVYRKKFIYVVKTSFERFGIQSIVNNYNTYQTSSPTMVDRSTGEILEEDEDEDYEDDSFDDEDDSFDDEDEDGEDKDLEASGRVLNLRDQTDEEISRGATADALERMGGNTINYGWEIPADEEKKDE